MAGAIWKMDEEMLMGWLSERAAFISMITCLSSQEMTIEIYNVLRKILYFFFPLCNLTVFFLAQTRLATSFHVMALCDTTVREFIYPTKEAQVRAIGYSFIWDILPIIRSNIPE